MQYSKSTTTLFLLLILLYLPHIAPESIVFSDEEKPWDLGSQKVKTKTAEISVNEQLDFEWGGAKQKVGPVWTIFTLLNSSSYEIPSWELLSHCGYWEQKCSDHCQDTKLCRESNPQGGIFNVFTMVNTNWCHGVQKKGGIPQEKHKLHAVVDLALTSWQGHQKAKEGSTYPGWTITNSSLNGFSKNALLLEAKTHIDLKNFFITEKHGLLNEKELVHLTDNPPNFTVNYNKTDCWNNTIAHSLHPGTSPKKTAETGDFQVYSIYKKASKAFQDLRHRSILTNKGLKRFSPIGDDDHQPFEFFDPCNRQFLSLVEDKDKSYLVYAVKGQNTHEFFCIALKHDVNDPYDLYLYEFKNGTKSFLPSQRFIGALSPDYVQSYTLQVTKADSEITNWKDVVPLVVDFSYASASTFEITYTSSTKAKCKIYLSSTSNPSDVVTFTFDGQSRSYSHSKSELPLLAHGLYDCDDAHGTFVIPANYTSIPGTHVTPEAQNARAAAVIYWSPVQKNQDLGNWRAIVKLIEGELQVLHNLIAIFLVLIIFIITGVVGWYQLRSYKKRKSLRKESEDDSDEEIIPKKKNKKAHKKVRRDSEDSDEESPKKKAKKRSIKKSKKRQDSEDSNDDD